MKQIRWDYCKVCTLHQRSSTDETGVINAQSTVPSRTVINEDIT